jgi:hypothetical protein
MWQDEIHQIREEHAKSFNYDLDAMFADWQKKQAKSCRKIISKSLKPRTQPASISIYG